MRDSKKTVTKAHFEKALNMVRPTVTDDMLEYYKKMESLLVSGLSTVRRGKDTQRGMESVWGENISVTVFGYELVGREVFDKSKELLGVVTEIHINYDNGNVEFICVKLEKGINSTKLPWTAKDNIVQVPPSEIDRLEGSIFLRR